MKESIVNLTNHLIAKNRYYRYPLNADFIEHVRNDLEEGDIYAMSPGKLGEIMCSLEVGDVLMGKAELLAALHFSGDCEELLRELVSLCLAYVIRDRLSEYRTEYPYFRPIRAKKHSSFRLPKY